MTLTPSRTLRRAGICAVVLFAVGIGSLHAQGYDFVVYDPWSVAQAILEVFNLVREYTEMLHQGTRLPVDLAARYHGLSVPWVLDSVDGFYARNVLAALNSGDAAGNAYRQFVDPLELPTDVQARMPVELQRRLAVAYGTVELADRAAERAIDQVGGTRAIGESVLDTIRTMEQDATSSEDSFNTQTALLNKLNGASVLQLRLADRTNQFLLSALEQQIVSTTRLRSTEAELLDATIFQWRFGQAYGGDLFRNTTGDLDGWRIQ